MVSEERISAENLTEVETVDKVEPKSDTIMKFADGTVVAEDLPEIQVRKDLMKQLDESGGDPATLIKIIQQMIR